MRIPRAQDSMPPSCRMAKSGTEAESLPEGEGGRAKRGRVGDSEKRQSRASPLHPTQPPHFVRRSTSPSGRYDRVCCKCDANAASLLLVARVENLEARPALIRARSRLFGDRIDIVLAGLAQKVGFYRQRPLGRALFAAALEEHAADGGFTRCRRKIRARPSLRPVAIDDREPEHVRHAPLGGSRARIGDEAKS